MLEGKKGEVIKIDLEGGLNPVPDFIIMDHRDLPSVHVLHDIEENPWPFPDECATLIMAGHVVEHVDPTHRGFIKFMDEAWRILKVGGQMMISTPYAGSTAYFSDPANVNPCTPQTFFYFDPLNPSGLYKRHMPKPWEIKTGYPMWYPDGNMEVLLVKRKEDPSYKKI